MCYFDKVVHEYVNNDWGGMEWLECLGLVFIKQFSNFCQQGSFLWVQWNLEYFVVTWVSLLPNM